MELAASQKKTIRHQFDSFCRKVLREEARNYIKHIAWQSGHEVSLSELSEEQLAKLYVIDEYPSDQFCFWVQGISVAVKDERLANAISFLPDEKRSIVLLSYFLGMTDQEIADRLDMMRRTVHRRRTRSLVEMKRRLEDKDDGKQIE